MSLENPTFEDQNKVFPGDVIGEIMNKMDRKNLEENIGKICLMEFVNGLWFPFPIFFLFFLDCGMTLTQIGIILGTSTLSSFIFDMPSSVWADKYSRKFLLILSGICFLLADMIFLLFHSFFAFLIAMVLSGMSGAFKSGVSGALTYDTLLSLGKENQYEKIQSKITKSVFLGRLIASLIGGYVYFINSSLVFLLAVITNILTIMVILLLKEPPREKSISKSFHQIKQGLEFLLKNKTVWNLIIVFSIMAAICDVLFAYYVPVLKASKVSLTNLGIISFFINALGFVGAGFYLKIKSKINWKNFMVIYFFIALISSMFFGMQIAVLVLFSIGLLSLSLGSQDIYIGNILHRIVPSSHRATTLSVGSQLRMLMYFVFINVISFSIDHSSIFIGMLISTLIVFVALLVFLKMSYRGSAIAQVE